MQEWHLTEAKNHFSQLVNRALTQGPQRVRCRKGAVVVVSVQEFDRLAAEPVRADEDHAAGESFEELNLKREPDPHALSLD